MVQHTTVYRYDYKDPQYYSLELEKPKHKKLSGIKTGQTSKCAEECDCAEKYNLGETKIQFGVKKSPDKKEWTGNQIMGRFLEPKMIGNNKDSLTPNYVNDLIQEKDSKKIIDNNNVVLVLQNCYPDLYERLIKMQQKELSRNIEQIRNLTTYQADYINYFDKIHEQCKNDNEINKTKLNYNQCDDFKKDPEITLQIKKILECQPGFPVNVKQNAGSMRITDFIPDKKDNKNDKKDNNRNDKNNNENKNVTSTADRKPKISEYRDIISRTGCVIMANRIHDHKTCKFHCSHQLKDPCAKYQ